MLLSESLQMLVKHSDNDPEMYIYKLDLESVILNKSLKLMPW